MNRLQKKCFIGSAGVHGLLFLILLIGPAFLSSKQKPDRIDPQTLNFVPSILIDGAFSGGGNPKAKPPPRVEQIVPSPPSPPQPKVAAAQNKPEPERRPPEKPPRIDPDSVEPKTPPKHRPQINTIVVTRNDSPKISKNKTSDNDNKAEERKIADAKRRLSQQFAQAAQSIREGTSSATTIQEFGPGGGGDPYGEYAAWVKTIYENAWQAPDDTATDDAITKVKVTIGSDGTVLSSNITRPSGDAQVDNSVDRTLRRVTFIAPFPKGAKEKQRTYIINFNLRAKRGLA